MTRIFRKRTRRNYGNYDQRKHRRQDSFNRPEPSENPVNAEENHVDEASLESFPASDAPSWTPGNATGVDKDPPPHKKRYIVKNKPHRPILKRRPEHCS